MVSDASSVFPHEEATVESYNIAGLFSLTYPDGSVAQWGVDSKDAMTLAVKELNAEEAKKNSIITFRLRLASDDIVDSRCDPVSSKSKAQALLERVSPLHALLGADCSGVYKVIADSYQAAKVSEVQSMS